MIFRTRKLKGDTLEALQKISDEEKNAEGTISFHSEDGFMKYIQNEIDQEKSENPIKYYVTLFWFRLDIKGRYYKLKYGIKNLIKWLPVIWKDRDWDDAYLLDLMSFKMENMSKLQSKHGSSEDAEILAKQLMDAALTAKRISDEEYYDHPDVKKLKEEKRIREAYRLENQLLEDDLENLFANMRQNIRRWWD